jgi:hypothetical protein
MPVRAAKSSSSFLLTANESCASRVTVTGANADGTADGATFDAVGSL